MFFITVLALISVAVYLYPKISIWKINEQIEEANYCQQDSDCTLIAGQCPFGCWLAVNVNEVEAIQSLVNGYKSSCVYGCVECQQAICLDNQCQEVCQ